MANRTILLVEDNQDDEALALRALAKHKIANRVEVARDGVEALEYLFDNGDSASARPLPQVVLLDVKLPRVDGLEVLRRIRADPRTSLMPVVMLTSSREERDLIESYRLGANSYIIKPVDYDQFTEAVGRLGIYWLIVNQGPAGSEQ